MGSKQVILSVLIGIILFGASTFVADAYAMTKADLIAHISEKTSSGKTIHSHGAECSATDSDGNVLGSDDSNRAGIIHIKLRSSDGDLPTPLTLSCEKPGLAGTTTFEIKNKRFIKASLTMTQTGDSPDSFFDVFFDVFTVDSFFDILLPLQDFSERTTGVDSFFDIFTEISVHNADVEQIQTELLSLDLRGQSCNVGSIVSGINPDGTLICIPAGQGGNPFGDLQQAIDDKNAEIAGIESDIATTQAEIANLQSQITAIQNDPAYDTCNLQYLQTLQVLKSQLVACKAEAAQLQVDPTIHCANQQAALDNHVNTCNDDLGITILQQQISSLQSQLDALNELLTQCEIELSVLQVLLEQTSGSAQPTCPNDCSGNGVCGTDNMCICDIGFSGDDCSIEPPVTCDAGFESVNGQCIDIDECSDDPNLCGVNSVCTNSPGSFSCACEAGFFQDSTGQCTLMDSDNDGYLSDVDCDDGDSSVNPGSSEIAGDGIDNNCDGIIDNFPPIVDAGLDQTASTGSQDGCVATFVGTASDPDSDPISIQWSNSFVARATVDIDSPNSLTTDVTITPTISVPAIFITTLTLTVSDGFHTSTDTAIFTCNP